MFCLIFVEGESFSSVLSSMGDSVASLQNVTQAANWQRMKKTVSPLVLLVGMAHGAMLEPEVLMRDMAVSLEVQHRLQ